MHGKALSKLALIRLSVFGPRDFGLSRELTRFSVPSVTKLYYRILAASSANSDRSPFCNSMCAAIGSVRKRLTT
jgi:hypothetical protein